MGSSIASRFVNWQGGVLMSIIAFSVVFLVTGGLMFMMMALKLIVQAINPEKPAAAPAPAESARSAPQPPSMAAAVRYEPPASGEDELAAIFAAAIADMSGHAAAVLSYAPVEMAFRRPSISAWRMTGILSNSRGLRD
ncbi:MAG: OadG family protein [Synergistaceae bacterium]|jgi:Na+-transporting methylmalonyl-CoA/oxaloacetate decarboxylase gamma subunit|nr:OadG family protein [Synergistaceae bacterium]